ncbi:response regulator [Bacillus sp. BGMRC 2118]|nr:response regulator [Bacillus sp. BGMRC 2118]
MRKSILVVDDEPITLRGIKKTLESWSEGEYEILTATNAVSAFEMMKTKKIHLLITDICMPEINGLELVKQVKEINPFPVVIIVSAHSDFAYAQEAIEIGVVNYLLKPINKQKLLIEVTKALEVESKRQRADMIEKVVDERLMNIESNLQPDSPVTKALKYVDENIHTSLTLKEVASFVHLNSSYFSVIFKEQTTLTFSEYVTRSRIQKAKNLLLTSNSSVSEIAESVGYSTSKYFIKIFKEYEGMTPSKYKE